MINIGTLELADIAVGSTPIEKAYIGSTLVWEKSSPLLYDAQVEWLATDGVAYIDTGITVSNTVKFDFDIYSEYNHLSIFFGARTGTSSGLMTIMAKNQSGASDNGIRWSFGTKNVVISNHKLLDTNTRVNFKNTSAARTLVYDGTYSMTATSQTFSTSRTLYMFKMNNNGTAGGNEWPLRCYYLKIWTGSTLVRDFIPVRKNGVGYLYDKVSEELFGNANSTGAFTYGNDVT